MGWGEGQGDGLQGSEGGCCCCTGMGRYRGGGGDAMDQEGRMGGDRRIGEQRVLKDKERGLL